MKLRLFFAAMLLGLAMPATADYVTIELAYEVALSEVRLPRSEAGTIAFRECGRCEFRTKRVDPETRWVVNGRTVTLRKFQEAVSQVADRSAEAVTILHHLERNRITQVSVYL